MVRWTRALNHAEDAFYGRGRASLRLRLDEARNNDLERTGDSGTIRAKPE